MRIRHPIVTLLVILGLCTLASAQASRQDNSIFTGSITPVTPMGALFQAAPPAITDGNVGAPRMDANRQLMINCISGCGGSGGTSFQDLNPVTAGTTTFTLTGGYRDDVSSSVLAEGQAGIVRMTTNRAFHVNLRDAAGNEITSLGGGGSTFGAAFPATGSASGFSDGVNMQSARVFDVDSGAGFQYVLGVNLRLSGAGGSTEVSAGTPLPITCISGCAGAGGTSSSYGAAFPAIGTAVGFSDGVTNIMRSGRVYDIDTGAGTEHTLGVSVRISGNGGSTEASAATPLPVQFFSGGSAIAPSVVETDDASVAGGQANVSLSLGINYVWDGTNWVRRTQDPCDNGTKSQFTVNIATATTTVVQDSSVGNRVYICAVNLSAGAAQGVAIIEDDTAGCGSPTAGINGGLTGATGWQFLAGGGIAQGDGRGTLMRSSTTNRCVGIVTSTTGQLSGTIMYVLAP